MLLRQSPMSDDRPKTPKDSHYARLRRQHRSQSTQPAGRPGAGKAIAPSLPADGLVRLYGLHTARAALDNPRRKISRVLATRNALRRLGLDEAASHPFPLETVDPREIEINLVATLQAPYAVFLRGQRD